MLKEERKLPKQSLHVTNDCLNIWVEAISQNITTIHVTDPDLSLTYYVADFDGSKYHIKHSGMFNDVFLRTVKKKPKIMRDLLLFHYKSRKDIDVFDDFKISVNCLKRKVNIYTKKTINKAKYKLFL
jgi:DNA polymerase elongation subunit (family B)